VSTAEAPRRSLGLDTPLRYLRGVGPKRAATLENCGFSTLGDLIYHLPSRYEDRRRVCRPGEVTGEGSWTVAGELRELRLVRTRRRGFQIVRGRLVDGASTLAVSWFNQPYLLDRWSDGAQVVLHGTARALGIGQLELVNPSISAAGSERGIVPVYPSLGGLGPAAIQRLVSEALSALGDGLPTERLPEELLKRYSLPELPVALATLHRPGPSTDPEAMSRRESPAHLRLVYGELLEMQLGLAELRRREIVLPKPHRYQIDDRVRSVAREILPFRLTAAQKRVLREIVDDLRGTSPMLRLLQGDVGSGKTIVAAMAMLIAAESGLQAAFMAPTELLAEQHHANLSRLLGPRHPVEMVSGSRRDGGARRRLASGEARLVVGTHALIQEAVSFRHLALAVIDEQHRFGVEQRKLLQAKGSRPDVLVMTATPIPRTLSLTLYGDLETSVLDELPPGRTPIATEVVPAAERRRVYRRLEAELAAGARAYVVFPLIDESQELAASSLAELGAKVRTFLSSYPSAVLHGRLPAAERNRLLEEFAAGRLRLLVATTVIEVGIDVPEATMMVIESAERFGLAQLHQLRGRVGRGVRASRCIAIHGRLSGEAEARLASFAATNDGFELAEADLRTRGPGDLLGTRQAGIPRLRIADLVAHREWVERARSDAREVLEREQEAQFRVLVEEVRRRVPERHAALAGG